MIHQTPLITTLVAALGLAFAFGTLANRLRLPTIIGYLIAGVVIGPFTPGFVADQMLAQQLAEVGVLLLMFGVGLHLSIDELLSVRAIAVPGALGQIAIVSLLGGGLAHLMGWNIGAAIVFGLSLSVASTVVVLRTLDERRLLETERGRIAIGWLIVEDISVILALVLLPLFAAPLGGLSQATTQTAGLLGWFETQTVWSALGLTAIKIAAFVLLMVVVGKRVIPWVLHYTAHTGSRELFRLAVLAVALGVAYGAAELFGISLALGAFFAGVILAESRLSQRAAQETLPFRDAFAVLFFVSVGMLFDPTILVRETVPIIGTFLVIVLGNAIVAFAITLALRYPLRTALTMGASMSQIGEFSFILSGLGVALKLLPDEGRDLILAGAILSILVNPLLFAALIRVIPWLTEHEQQNTPDQPAATSNADEANITELTGHAVLVGYGRVGSRVAEAILADSLPLLIIEERQDVVEQLRARGIEAFYANALKPDILRAAKLSQARWFISAIPNPFEGGNLIQQARAANPNLEIIARAHSDAEVEHLAKFGADLIIMGEREIARGIIEHIRKSRTKP
ncbi:YbaL family putative K(+) efflux transporter [Phyllobacterium lublinensis]|uniref:YbaL family putative K(+) efflux transporter n=1 Tax=Phyllobacterium lublinensis TaxID=2875708 RepID=UPI001CCDE2CC|nr:YbaL family putative K(+) efflux transporter [Phyllobacterium sp. 2063]MBZ9657227.1 Kef family K(+) transporter [Phyllobacterium sp. 2063]